VSRTITLFLLILSGLAYGQILQKSHLGPGITYYHEFRASGPWHIHVLEIDLKVQGNHLETALAQDKIKDLEKTSSMAARNNYQNHHVVAAINGDFFEADGMPVGSQVLNGILIKSPTDCSIFGISKKMKPFIDIVSFQGWLWTDDKSSFSINGVNERRDVDELIIYNKYFGVSSATNRWGIEITAESLSPNIFVNDTFYVKVTAKDSSMAAYSGNNEIPSKGVILSGHGVAAIFLNNHININDTLAILLQLLPQQDSILELIGGLPRLIRNGKVSVEWAEENIYESFVKNRHPRTAIAFSQDSSIIYFFTIDGRQPDYSVGMSLYELAYYMLEWHAFQGLNLDGGGSTTMVVGNKVVNSPSDPEGERAVANAILIINTLATVDTAAFFINTDQSSKKE